MIKIDWLSFVFKANDEDKATYSNIWEAFISRFPEIEDILDETVIMTTGKNYYSAGVLWNDGISICWDDRDTTGDFYFYSGKQLEPWEHGVYVSFPAHGLHYLSQIVGLSDKNLDLDGNFADIKPILQVLKDRQCELSRLDIAFDDTTRTFVPRDFFRYWDNNQVQSPCHNYTFCGSKGTTFYVGSRRNKILRIYDKTVESKGEIDAIRYEIEMHNRYARDVSEMILSDNFNFFELLQKWFIRLKSPATCESLNEKSQLSRLPDLPEWESFISSQNVGLSHCVFPVHPKDITFERKEHWLHHTVAPSILMYSLRYGIDGIIDLLNNTCLTPHNRKLLDDCLRINNIAHLQQHEIQSKNDIIRLMIKELGDAFGKTY